MVWSAAQGPGQVLRGTSVSFSLTYSLAHSLTFSLAYGLAYRTRGHKLQASVMMGVVLDMATSCFCGSLSRCECCSLLVVLPMDVVLVWCCFQHFFLVQTSMGARSPKTGHTMPWKGKCEVGN